MEKKVKNIIKFGIIPDESIEDLTYTAIKLTGEERDKTHYNTEYKDNVNFNTYDEIDDTDGDLDEELYIQAADLSEVK